MVDHLMKMGASSVAIEPAVPPSRPLRRDLAPGTVFRYLSVNAGRGVYSVPQPVGYGGLLGASSGAPLSTGEADYVLAAGSANSVGGWEHSCMDAPVEVMDVTLRPRATLADLVGQGPQH